MDQFSLTADQRPLIDALTDVQDQFQHTKSIGRINQRVSALERNKERLETSCPLSISVHFAAVQAILNSAREEKATNDLKDTLSCSDICPHALIDITPLNKITHRKQSELIFETFSAMNWAAVVNTLMKWTEKMGNYLIIFRLYLDAFSKVRGFMHYFYACLTKRGY